MAGSLLASLPIIAIFTLLQRQFIQGIATSGIKG
jgi:multiple sugar transport system permease protein